MKKAIHERGSKGGNLMGFGEVLDRRHHFDVAGRKLARRGWDVIPIPQRTKRCLVPGWQTISFGAYDFRSYTGCGIGIRTRCSPAIDIDVRDAKLANLLEDEVRSMLGETLCRIGSAPKRLLLYRLSNDSKAFQKKLTRGFRLPGDTPEAKPHRVEILANGQQFVAYNIHPGTLRNYRWRDGVDPLSVELEGMRSITASQAKKLIIHLDSILAKHGEPVGALRAIDEAREYESNESLLSSNPTITKRQIQSIPNDDASWDDWMVMGLAIKGALGQKGRRAFLQWSAKSIKHIEDESEKLWRGLKPTRIGAGSIHHWAVECGWKPPRMSKQAAINLIMAQELS